MSIEPIPIEREWELLREIELNKNLAVLQGAIDDMKQDPKCSDEPIMLATEKLLEAYKILDQTKSTPSVAPLSRVLDKSHKTGIEFFAPASVLRTSSAKVAQLPDLTNTLLTTAFNLITGFVFAVHAIFMQWGILFLAGQMVMIEFNDMLREDIDKLLDGETPDLSSPGIIAIILWTLETLIALTLTLVVQEQKSDKSWVSWAWKVGSWAVTLFFVVDGIAVITVILFLTGNMDIQNVWVSRLLYSLTSIGGYIGSQKAVTVVGANMPKIKAYGKDISTKFANMSARVTATIGGPWRDSLPARSSTVADPAKSRVIVEDMFVDESGDDEEH